MVYFMSKINVGSLAQNMLAAAEQVLKVHWNDVRPFAETEMQKLAATAIQIEAGVKAGSLNNAQAKILLRMQENASLAVLTAVETVGMIAAQDAINAAIQVLATAVNAAVGFAVL
jgi:hypothetical protein